MVGDMELDMTTQDPDVGVLTKADLREALRVNRALEVTALGDMEFREHRIESCRQRIRDQEILIREWNTVAETAPERLARIRAKIAKQEEMLESWKEDKAGVVTPQASREATIQLLVARIGRGGEDAKRAIEEMAKLAKG